MKIYLRQIPEEGLHLSGEEAGDILQLEDPEQIRAIGPLRYDLDVGVSEGGLWATGRLALDLEMQCVRCLEKFIYPVVIDDLGLQVELAGEETIDLTPHLREDIILALPAYPHCDWAGDKSCPASLRAQEVAGREQDGAEGNTADGAGASSAWQTLDQLKTSSK